MADERIEANAGTIQFAIIDAYAPDDIKEWAKNKDSQLRKLLSSCIIPGGEENICRFEDSKPYTCIPLVLCEDAGTLKRKGAVCPYEFIISRCDLLDKETLSRRLATLNQLYGKKENAITIDQLKDWFAASFRKYLFLDGTVHGTAGVIDLDNIDKDTILQAIIKDDQLDGDAKKLKARFCEKKCCKDDEMDAFREFFNKLYSKYFIGDDSLTKAFNDKNIGKIKEIYTDANRDKCGKPLGYDKRLPRSYGDRSCFVTPTGKLNLLLIDDNVESSPFCWLSYANKADATYKTWKEKFGDDWALLEKMFNVRTFQIEAGVGTDIYEQAISEFKKYQEEGLWFDVALVDLCMSANGEDLSGYEMIKRVRQFFPHLPVIVYSKFSDMEHIARAFWCGAKWFLKKGEEDKLPRHILHMLRQPGWHREWAAVKKGKECPEFNYEKKNTRFEHVFDRNAKWKYLTYKCLEYFPGRAISVEKMGGGISSAVTFKAVKGAKVGDEYLQMPSIIKIDSAHSTMMEFERYFRMIRPYMANEAGRIEKPERILNRDSSAIVYTFAGKQDGAHQLKAMSSMIEADIQYKTTCDFEKYRYALNCVFDEILPKIHRVSPLIEFSGGTLPQALTASSHDAFAIIDYSEVVKESSFPNPYFNECLPDQFWKSYAMRFMPYGRMELSNLQEIKIQKPDGNRTYLTFHNVMPDPRDKSKFIIEAYTKDKELMWLDGDASDFIARFRRHIHPGCSLWFDKNIHPTDIREKWLKKAIDGWDATPCGDKNDELLKSFAKAALRFTQSPFEVETIVETIRQEVVNLQDQLLSIATKVSGNASRWECRCPVGIVHGDLNLANIMLESRLHAPKENSPDTTSTVSDVWFIDFARTRRDIVAHDFNVFFTSVLSFLFMPELLKDSDYLEALENNFKTFVVSAVSADGKSLLAIPDAFKDDERLIFVYKMLRRGREAALKAGISQNMYTLTTALTCMYTMKIFLNNKKKGISPEYPLIKAAGFFSVAKICFDLLPKTMRDAAEAPVSATKSSGDQKGYTDAP